VVGVVLVLVASVVWLGHLLAFTGPHFLYVHELSGSDSGSNSVGVLSCRRLRALRGLRGLSRRFVVVVVVLVLVASVVWVWCLFTLTRPQIRRVRGESFTESTAGHTILFTT